MREGEPAGSAQAVALFRALESARPPRDRLFHDPHAFGYLDAGSRRVLTLFGAPFIGPVVARTFDALAWGQRAFLVARTALIDEALRAALKRGVAQVLMLGAGYDSRAERIPGIEHARVFEVDHPSTQARKHAILSERGTEQLAHVCFVSVDFNRQDLGQRLDENGFRRGVNTFVVWEGVTEYLEPGAADATLRWLGQATAPESELVFTYVDRALLDGRRRFRGGALHLAALRALGESFTFGLDPAGLEAFLGERGFELLEDLSGEALVHRCFEPRGRRDRPNDYQRLARARIVAPREDGKATSKPKAVA